MTVDHIKQIVQSNPLRIAMELYPNGKEKSGSWIIGDVNGTEGTSFTIPLSGQYAGSYKDWADPNEKGDLIGLWMKRKGIDFKTALIEIGSLYGVSDIKIASTPLPVAKKSNIKQLSPTRELEYLGFWYDYFKERGIPSEVVSKYKLEETENGSLCYPVYDDDGNIIYRKYQKRQRSDKGKKICAQDKGISGEQRLIGKQCCEGKEEIVITEGEEDMMVASMMGFDAVSMPQGANSLQWIDNDYDWLMSYSTIVLCFDMDEPGRKATTNALDRLGSDKCAIVELPEKDLNDTWMSGYQLIEIEQMIHGAKRIEPEKFKSASDYQEEILSLIDPDNKSHYGTPSPFESLRFNQRLGELTVWTGWSSHGKTMALSQWILNDLENDKRAIIASMEVSIPKSIILMARQRYGVVNQESIHKISEYLNGKVWFYDNTGVADKKEMLDTFLYARRRYDCRIGVIDSLSLCGVSEKDIDEQKDFVTTLRDFADFNEMHLHLVAHSGKNDTKDESKMPSKFDVRGGVAITDIAHNGVTVFRNKKAPEERKEGESDSIIKVWKQRETGEENMVKLKFDPMRNILKEMY
jgi:twinkle protein